MEELLVKLKITLMLEKNTDFDTVLLEILERCISVIKLYVGITILTKELQDICLLMATESFNKLGEEGISSTEVKYFKILEQYQGILDNFINNGILDNNSNPYAKTRIKTIRVV